MLPFSVECNFFNAVITFQARPTGSWQFYKLFLVWYGVFVSYFDSEILALCLAIKINSCRCGLNKLCECGKIEAEFFRFSLYCLLQIHKTCLYWNFLFSGSFVFFQLHYIVWCNDVIFLYKVCVLKVVCSFEECIKEMAGVHS